jgi:hypothetical protein
MWALAAFGLSACSAPPSSAPPVYPTPEVHPEGKVVATIGPVRLTTREMEARIEAMNPIVRQRLKDPEQLTTFVRNQVQAELLAQEAFRRGLFDHPNAVEAMRQAAVKMLFEDWTSQLEVKVDEADVVAMYEARRSEYFQPERIRLAQLSLATEGSPGPVLARMKRVAANIRAEVKKGNLMAFDRYAQQLTAETGLDRAKVDLGFLSRDEVTERYNADIATTTFDDMTVGDVEVFTLPGQVILMKKTGRRNERKRSLESVRSSLVNKLRQQKRGEAIEAWVRTLAEQQGVSLEVEHVSDIQAFPEPTPATP